jgi:hypothetical protein
MFDVKINAIQHDGRRRVDDFGKSGVFHQLVLGRL